MLFFKEGQPFHLHPQPGTNDINIAKCVIGGYIEEELGYWWELVGTAGSLEEAVKILRNEIRKEWEPETKQIRRQKGILQIKIGMYNAYRLIGMVYMDPDKEIGYFKCPNQIKVQDLKSIESLSDIFRD